MKYVDANTQVTESESALGFGQFLDSWNNWEHFRFFSLVLLFACGAGFFFIPCLDDLKTCCCSF